MAKIAYDKYYTPPIVAKWCIEKTKEIIGENNITERLIVTGKQIGRAHV